MIGIYKITNKVNGKVYIGQAVDIERRWKEHKKRIFYQNGKDYHSPLYRSMRKHGLNNFSFEVVEECPAEELNDKEIFYIALYDTYNQGYNQTEGGNSHPHYKLTPDDITAILHRLKTTSDNTRIIAKDFGVGFSTIRGINVGAIYKRDSESYPIRLDMRKKQTKTQSPHTVIYRCPICNDKVQKQGSLCVRCAQIRSRKANRPEPLELARLIKEKGFEPVGKQFGVSGKTITKWCKSYDIPHTKKELITWYNQKMGIIEPTKEGKRKPTKTPKIQKPVHQIDITTQQIINTFPSAYEAGKYLNVKNPNHISLVCRGIRKIAYGYYWEYANKE